MAGRTFSKLFRVLGGAEALAERINALIDRLEAGAAQRRLLPGTIYSWGPNNFPVAWRPWVLAAALDAGMTKDQAVSLCPELKPAAALAQFISWRLEARRAA